jgi:hypothetical protein
MSGFCTIDHNLHRQRRSAMDPFFSKQRIQLLEPSIQAQVDKLCARLEEFKGTEKVLRIRDAYSCFASDIVMDYCTGSSLNHLNSPNFLPLWRETLQGANEAGVTYKYFPWLLKIMKLAPKGLVQKAFPGLALIYAFEEVSLII